ncbi:MAG: hypothetical protein E6G55_00270 [Actinobacteria bacterium]|nr:MAG: hypothetical protein E6G55_00270 [Actinomycetota bacterium]
MAARDGTTDRRGHRPSDPRARRERARPCRRGHAGDHPRPGGAARHARPPSPGARLGAAARPRAARPVGGQGERVRAGSRGPRSIDAVSDRDFVQEFVAHAAILGTHLSRLAADLLRWTDESLGWASIDDAYATGSSMMPQKRNPDVAELARAKAARLGGHVVALTSMLAGLPLGYHRDLQEDKGPAFDAADTVEATLGALAGCVETLRVDEAAMREAAEAEALYATDLAEELVRAGVPFRQAHRRIGELLKRLHAEHRSLRSLGPDEWRDLGLPEGASLLDPDRSVRARSMPGGPSPASVLAQAQAIEATLAPRNHGVSKT